MKRKALIQLYKESGRTLPIKSGYRPNFYIDDNNQSDCVITLLYEEKCEVGENATIEIELISPHLINTDKVLFYLREGNRVVAIGIFV
jgi:translation elongation factor EF-Tu-like GTPase